VIYKTEKRVNKKDFTCGAAISIRLGTQDGAGVVGFSMDLESDLEQKLGV